MINAPQEVVDALKSGNFKEANLFTINLGDAHNTGSDLILYLTDCPHTVSFGGNTYSPDHAIVDVVGISRKASTGSDSVEIPFSVTDESIVNAIRAERYVNKLTKIDRVVMNGGAIIGDFAIPIRGAWGLSHSIEGDIDDRTVTLTIDSTLGDLHGDNGWYAINSSHQQRHPNDFIMKHSATVMTEEQQKKYTTNFSGAINQEIKPPALPKIYGYKNAELVPIAMLKHRKTHTSYRHYFTTLIYVVSIGDIHTIDSRNLVMDDEQFGGTIVSGTQTDVGGWSVRFRSPVESSVSIMTDPKLNFWREGMDSSEVARLNGMLGKGLTLLFVKNRNRDDWLQSPPKFSVPINGALVYDPRDSSTKFSRNPALQYADFLRSTEYGAGKRGVTVDDSNIEWLADHFDQIPDSIGNDGINSILIDVQVDTGEPLVDNMNIWMEGVRLYTSDYYGKYNIRVETKEPISLTIDESELLDFPDYDSGEFTDRINQLTYTIKQLVPDESEDAEVGDLIEVDVEATFPADGSQIHDDWLAEDGGIVNFDSEQLDYVTILEQAFYWTMVDARISRLPRTMELPIGAIGWLTEVGDVIDFSSGIMGMQSVLWRVQEVSEDEEKVQLNLVAYDDNFYTPDPDAIPDPAGTIRPPSSVALSPVSDLNVIFDNGYQYLTWSPLSSENVLWYAVEIEKDGEPFYDNPRVAQPPVLLENLVAGAYEAKVTAIGNKNEGEPATLIFNMALPVAPIISVVAVETFEIEISVSSPVISIGQSYEVRIGQVNDVEQASHRGTGSSVTVVGLKAQTTYYIFARTVNTLGKSEWASESATTLDGTKYSEVIPIEPIIDKVVDELQGELDDIIGDDPRQDIVDKVLGIQEGLITEENLITEKNTRKVEDGNNLAEIARVEQVAIDGDSVLAETIALLNVEIENNYATIVYTNTAVASEASARATSIQLLETNVADTYATIANVNQVESNVDGNANAISGIRTAVSGSDNQAQTELILESTVDTAGEVEGKAVLGVTAGGTFTGMSVVGGDDYSQLEFRANTLVLSDSSGAAQMSYSAASDSFVFAGRMSVSSDDSFAAIDISKTSGGGNAVYVNHSGSGGVGIYVQGNGNGIIANAGSSNAAGLVASNNWSQNAIWVSKGDISISSGSDINLGSTFNLSNGSSEELKDILADVISRLEALEP